MRKGRVWINRNPGNKWWYKEIVTLRKAADNHICDECHYLIPKGSYYYEDKFVGSCEEFESGSKSYIHRVCICCWRGVNLTGSLPFKEKLKLVKSRPLKLGDFYKRFKLWVPKFRVLALSK
jgi:hypothetical protein